MHTGKGQGDKARETPWRFSSHVLIMNYMSKYINVSQCASKIILYIYIDIQTIKYTIHTLIILYNTIHIYKKILQL